MRLITRAAIIFIILIILFTAFIGIYKYREDKESEHLLSELVLKDRVIIETQMKLRNMPVLKYIHDLSQWDDSVDYVRNRNSKYYTDNILLSGEIYNIGEIWIYTPDFKKVSYFKNRNINDPAGDIEALLPMLKSRFNSEKIFSFHYRKEKTVYLINAASIHPTSDGERRTRPAGFIITAVPFNKDFLNELKSNYPLIHDAEITIENKQPGANPGVLKISLPFSDINGNPAAYLNLNLESRYLSDLTEAERIQKYLFYIILSGFIIIITAFVHGVIRPVKEIYRALYENDYTPPKRQKYFPFEFIRILELVSLNKNVERKLADAIEEIEVQRGIAERATKAKSEFLANMSHEIRTPMTGVLGFSDMLRETTLNPEQLYLADGIKKSSKLILRIINDILDLSKIESGKFELSEEPFNINTLLEDVILILKGFAMDNGLVIILDNRITDCATVEGDEKRLRQILLNLGGNAVRYTLRGEVRVTASSIPISSDETEITFEVNDTGIGMTEEQISRIFDKYEQVHDPEAFAGGTGLGLAITKSLIEMMNGTMEVRSIPHSGSRFTFRLKMKSRRGEIAKPAPAGVRDLNLTILIAEDNLINMRVIENILKKAGCSCETCHHGQRAVELADSKKYDLILMDFQMPVLDGMEAGKTIRSGMGPNSSTPIYAISADMPEESREKSRKSGMNGFIMKPFMKEEIFSVLLKVKNNKVPDPL